MSSRLSNSRRMTLGPVSMNSNTMNNSKSRSRSPSDKSASSSSSSSQSKIPPPVGFTPSKLPKPRQPSRKSMLPRVGRDSLSFPQSSSPSNSSVKSSSTTTKTPSIPNYRRSIGGSNKSNHPNNGGGRPPSSSSTNSSASSRSTIVTATTTMLTGVNNNQNPSLIKHDPRPIQDKGYQQNCIRTLLSFLTKSGYPFPVTLKSLSQPSGKDFVQIVTFLLKKIDPTFGTLSSNPAAASELKLEEEVAFHFKALGYPYPVSKTSLVAAGSPHTWPSLLAALAWLVEHICVWNVGQQEDEVLYYNVFSNDASQEQHQTFQSLTELEIQTDRVFFAFLHQAYVAFLESNADKCDLWQEKLMDRFEHDNTILEREIERMTDLNATMVEKIHLLQQQSDGLPALTKKRESYATDLEQFHDLVRQMEEHCNSIAQKVQERSKELLQTQDTMGKLTSQIGVLQKKIATQPLSVEQVQKMNVEQARLKELLEKATSFQKYNKEGLEKSQQELTILWEDLELLIREYNEEASELSRCLSDFIHQPGYYKMILNKDCTEDQAALLGVNITHDLLPFLQKSQAQNHEIFHDAKRQLQSLQNDLESHRISWTEAKDKEQIISMKVEKFNEAMNVEADQQEATLQVRLREVEKIEERIDALRDPISLEEQICAFQRQCDSLERLRTQHEEETLSRKAMIQQEIQDAIFAVEEFHTFVAQKLEELEAYATAKRNSVPKTIPSLEHALE